MEFLHSDLEDTAAGRQELRVGMFVSTVICLQNGPPGAMKAPFLLGQYPQTAVESNANR